MPRADKLAKATNKAAASDKPVVRAIKAGDAGSAKALPAKPAAKSTPRKPPSAVADDVPVIALNLEAVKLTPAMTAYFKKCQDRLGFVPNVLLAYAFDMAKLEPFVAMYNDLML